MRQAKLDEDRSQEQEAGWRVLAGLLTLTVFSPSLLSITMRWGHRL